MIALENANVGDIDGVAQQGLRLRQRCDRLRQLRRPFLDAPLKLSVRLAQRVFGALAIADVLDDADKWLGYARRNTARPSDSPTQALDLADITFSIETCDLADES